MMDQVDSVHSDVLIIGGGPSGLATAIRLADLLKHHKLQRRIVLVDKGNAIGSHILSGAVIKTSVFKQLLPEVDFKDIPFDAKVKRDAVMLMSKTGKIKIPFPVPFMRNKGNYLASLATISRFLAKIAEEKGVEIYSGFSVNEILYENGKVAGAKTIATGVDAMGNPMENFQAGTAVYADLVVFAESTRGTLSKQLIAKYSLDKNSNKQMYSLGCKELWHIPEGRIQAGTAYNCMGYPLNRHEFGGGFIYGLNDNTLALGLVVGLDYEDPTFDVHHAFQVWKTHPFISALLQGGKLLEYGAKTLPEGGFYAIPQVYTDHALIVGDSAGFLAMPALKGIHLAMESGMLAAETAIKALSTNDFSEASLRHYDEMLKKSRIYKELYPFRNFRQGFSGGLIAGFVRAAFLLLTKGAGISGRIRPLADSETTKRLKDFKRKTFRQRFEHELDFDKVISFDKVTDVYYSGTRHDEHQVPHLRVNNPQSFAAINIKEYGAPCQYFCPAEVYEIRTDKNGNKELRIHFENCVHCKTCDIKSPGDGISWMLPNGDNGPDYHYM